MDKQNVVYTYTMGYFYLKNKEILTHATTWMNLEDIDAEWNKPVTKRQILYDYTYMSYLEQSNS